ncbi:probable apyrase 7 [Phtheirospermum japonicum]|uniref:Probable apyrase 7 n=1 Tax=Phtheirospermum japonicum TaxID=374723 RepID=A0A830CKS1_9LAMI|nr:probable apyrase 7 [Phtheirospermum japonicum]
MVFSKSPPVSGYPFSSPETKGSLKHSYSLQDLSTYRRLDLEEGHAFHPHLVQKENGISGFSKDKISSKRNKCVQFICILVGLLLIACLSFALQFLYSDWFKGASKFYIVLDCGSTGTRVYVYEASINRNKKDNNLPVSLKSLPESFESKPGSRNGRAYNRMETEPGFDKLVRNISGLREAIEPLIQWAEKQIPKKSYKDTSLFLYATAGARRLPGSDSEWLLNNAWSILTSSPFSCKREWVKIITGVEEAYYGWIALNYHAGALGSFPKKETYGALDLGGSSLQVTFEGENDETSLNLSIGRVNHRLIAYSLAGYGLNDAFDKSVAYLIKKLPNPDLVSGKVNVRHPCLQSGYEEQYACRHCSDSNSHISVRLIGFPNWEECSALAETAVNSSEWSGRDNNNSPGIDCELNPCALSKNAPRPVGQFYAMSGFYVVYRFFNLTPDAALDDVLEKGREFCEKDWEVARKSVVPQPFIEQYCFRAPYVVLLLREGLHITDRRVVVGSGSVTWTLGMALFEAGKAFADGGDYYRGYDVLWAKMSNSYVVFFALMFVVVCGLCCVGKGWVTRLFRGPCLQILGRNSVTSTSVLNIPAPFRFRREGRVKTPLSPRIAGTRQSPFDAGLGFGSGSGGGTHFSETSLYSSSSGVAHSYSSESLGQMQMESNNLVSFWTPGRGQMHLQSRRSQSREDLNSSIAEAHLVKV